MGELTDLIPNPHALIPVSITVPLIIVLAYLIGSIPFALILARRWGATDLRHVGSGNLGAANVMRVSGVTAGVMVAALDMAKGAASVWLAEHFSAGPEIPAVGGVAGLVGHIYPAWLRFRGGGGGRAARRGVLLRR